MEFVVFVICLLGLFILSLSPSRGERGERIARRDIERSFNTEVYRQRHNVIIPSKNGTSQIDHLMVSPFGVFIIETKNIQGWIFGSEHQSKWIQSLYGDNFRFQNPLRQIYRQKKVLSQHLNIDENHVHCVVYFVGDCIFKNKLPPNVITGGLGEYITSYQNVVLPDEEISRITQQLDELLSDPSLTTESHLESLHKRYNSDVCPKCESKLVKRIAQRGRNAGKEFLGCSNYPQCKYARDLQS